MPGLQATVFLSLIVKDESQTQQTGAARLANEECVRVWRDRSDGPAWTIGEPLGKLSTQALYEAAQEPFKAATVHLWWLAEDEQSELDGGEYSVACDGAQVEAAFLAELLDQCGEDYQRDEVRAGRMVWR